MLDSDAQSTINSKVTQSAVDSSINTFKGTIIEGGKIKTELLEVTEIYATKGTVGGFSIGEKSLTNIAGDVQLSIGNLQGTKFAVMNDPNNSMLHVRNDDATAIYVYTHGTSGVGIYINAQTSAKAINSYGNVSLTARSGELIAISGTSSFATKSDEHTFISGLSLSVQQGVSWLRTSTDNHFAANDNVDYLIVTGSSTLPAANQNKGRLVFVTVRGSQAVLTVNGVYLSEGTYKSSANWTGGNSVFFISDGTYWYEFFCS
jgi:hypothetical protein